MKQYSLGFIFGIIVGSKYDFSFYVDKFETLMLTELEKIKKK